MVLSMSSVVFQIDDRRLESRMLRVICTYPRCTLNKISVIQVLCGSIRCTGTLLARGSVQFPYPAKRLPMKEAWMTFNNCRYVQHDTSFGMVTVV